MQLLANHEGLPLARTTIPAGQPGHLHLEEDSRGLHFDAQLDRNDREAQTVMFKVSAGLLDQCSFAFRVVPGGQEWNDDYTLRTIREVDLDRGDVSVCNYGASPTTSVVARSRRRAVANGLYAYKAHALALRGGNKASIDRTRRLIYLNEAGRRR